MLRQYKKGSVACIDIRVGDLVQYDDGRIGELKKIELKPNGVDDNTLIARLTVKFKDSTVTATSDKFTPVQGEYYLDN
jgi:hypothetical protein